jgi:hypothetical protein
MIGDNNMILNYKAIEQQERAKVQNQDNQSTLVYDGLTIKYTYTKAISDKPIKVKTASERVQKQLEGNYYTK